MTATICEGCRVAYSREFLRNIGAVAGFMPHARGNVTALDDLGRNEFAIARVLWDGAAHDVPVLASNLVREDRLHLERA